MRSHPDPELEGLVNCRCKQAPLHFFVVIHLDILNSGNRTGRSARVTENILPGKDAEGRQDATAEQAGRR